MQSVMWITYDEPVTVFIPKQGGTTAKELESLWILPTAVPAPEFIPPVKLRRYQNRIRPDRKKLWCDALRSGRYRQIYGRYSDSSSDGHCALGVLDELVRKSLPEIADYIEEEY